MSDSLDINKKTKQGFPKKIVVFSVAVIFLVTIAMAGWFVFGRNGDHEDQPGQMESMSFGESIPQFLRPNGTVIPMPPQVQIHCGLWDEEDIIPIPALIIEGGMTMSQVFESLVDSEDNPTEDNPTYWWEVRIPLEKLAEKKFSFPSFFTGSDRPNSADIVLWASYNPEEVTKEIENEARRIYESEFAGDASQAIREDFREDLDEGYNSHQERSSGFIQIEKFEGCKIGDEVKIAFDAGVGHELFGNAPFGRVTVKGILSKTISEEASKGFTVRDSLESSSEGIAKPEVSLDAYGRDLRRIYDIKNHADDAASGYGSYPNNGMVLQPIDQRFCLGIAPPDELAVECSTDPSGGKMYYGWKSDGERFELSAALEDSDYCLPDHPSVQYEIGTFSRSSNGKLCIYRVSGELPRHSKAGE